ncbi:MAG TPA: hypothetical protein DCQ37_03135 [Desulfobacteraceae bacterium]|nr:hypothetical protein [Desulfobacteraceae bacterium]
MKLRRLPVGDSSFESIRANDCVYVDKTRHLFQMVDEGKFYFLSRPRRFGKSLTVSVLRCLFQGKKDLFAGLWIADNTEWEWKSHPLVVLDFNGISHDTPENLKLSLQRTAMSRPHCVWCSLRGYPNSAGFQFFRNSIILKTLPCQKLMRTCWAIRRKNLKFISSPISSG